MSDTGESPPSVASGLVIAGRYKVDRRLGVGGMGEVYLVHHVHTDERLAMKVLLSTVISDSTALERFRREARTPARIDSDHVVRVTDADVAPELNGAPFLIMEYLRGEGLDQFLELNGAMRPEDVVGFLQQIARVLDKAHTLGIVHRDLKPENIFITRREDGSPHVKILDFGIAKFTAGALGELSNKTATSPGQIYGTPLYMSPEQAKGDSKLISGQTDIWALGLIASRMLTGEDYWDAETLTALIAQVVYEPMRKPSERGFDLGEDFDVWFLTCCNRDQNARFSTAGEAVFRLGQALGVIDKSAPYGAGTPVVLSAPPPSVSVRSSRERGLSKTDIQLAQTSATNASPSNPPQAKSPIPKVAAGAVAAGVLIAIGIFGFRGEATNTPGSAAPEVTTQATASGPPTTLEPIVSAAPMVSTAPSSVEPPLVAPTSATPTSAPSSTSSVRPTPGPGPIRRPPPSSAPTPTAPTTKPDVKKDPLDGRM
jgi:eukaryotic-like serine/threonine-protein kinase